MIISNITPPQVWSASQRSLTNIGSSALASTNTIFTSIAGASSVDLRTSAGIVGTLTVTVLTGVGATAAIALDEWDGTNNITAVATAAAASVTATITSVNCNTVGIRVRNTDATHAGSYIVAEFVWTI